MVHYPPFGANPTHDRYKPAQIGSQTVANGGVQKPRRGAESQRLQFASRFKAVVTSWLRFLLFAGQLDSHFRHKPFHVLPNLSFGVGIPQEIGRVVGDHDLDPLIVME